MLRKIDSWLRYFAGKAIPGLTMLLVMVNPYSSEEKKDEQGTQPAPANAVAQIQNAFTKGLLFDEEEASSEEGVSLPYNIYLAQAQMPQPAKPTAFSQESAKAFLSIDEEISGSVSEEDKLDAEYERLLEAYLNKVEDLILLKQDYAEALQEMDKMMLLAPMHPKVRNLKKLLNKKIKTALTEKRLPDNITLIPSPPKKESPNHTISLLKERALLEAERSVLEEKVLKRKSNHAEEKQGPALTANQWPVPVSASAKTISEFDKNQDKKNTVSGEIFSRSKEDVYVVPMQVYDSKQLTSAMPASAPGVQHEVEKPESMPAPLADQEEAELNSAEPAFAEEDLQDEFIDYAHDPFVSDEAESLPREKLTDELPQDAHKAVLPVEQESSQVLPEEIPVLESVSESAFENEKNFTEHFVVPAQPQTGSVALPQLKQVEQFIMRGKKYFQQQNYSLALISFSKARQCDAEGEHGVELDDLIHLTKERLDAMHYT